MNADTPDDSSIPILTERLTLPPLELDTTLPLEPQAPTTSAPTVPLALDTSLPLNLSLPQPPPPHLPPAVARTVTAPATSPTRTAPAPATSPTRTTPTAPAATVPPARAAMPAPAPPTAPTPAAAAPAAAALEPGGSHWSRIELAMRSSILQAIADALPQHVDVIVRNRMNDAIERLHTQLVAETRLAVAASLRDIVDQAVRAELARLRNQR
jgi:hypothetical protein